MSKIVQTKWKLYKKYNIENDEDDKSHQMHQKQITIFLINSIIIFEMTNTWVFWQAL